MRKCAGVNGAQSLASWLNRVRGPSLIRASNSHKMVCSSQLRSSDFPNTFLRAFFTDLTIRSQQPPHQGARSMLYLQSICRLANSSRIFSADLPCSKVRKKESACLNVRKLSDWITLCLPRRAMNRRKAAKKLIDVMSITSSKCTARVTMHVNKQM
ncbi:hypothetical protein T4D_5142 [Trichinella pseudospiralis]|uniref:Uncharacterized protein n=1 Tax=Trichinella pseudospiralis TaxID=6337 RepID=A0A0V1FUD0_TRIPS|nr:hypothetical protein T4D_5142 [Trichinella pseudospiralis]